MNKFGLTGKKSILIADDDADDREMLKAAFEESEVKQPLCFVENGEELLLFLKRKGKYADDLKYPFPHIVLLDLNMPKKDGREALHEIKTDKALKTLPVVVLTTSTEEKDILKTYELGVNSYVIKPVTYKGLVEFTRVFQRYWLDISELPYITG
ncbi:response regulator [Chitinophaga horti]|uniref:Response regulator n=1 Tax=Chitinophaga horti TaxID=2920382 RepID=A0ABY6IZ98_9BACT|nr:response regulator [Chitinophaga horti]UYQ92700.1 response regulator [Chitinophaga horti]